MLAFAALLLALAADDLTPEKAAKVQKDRDAAMAEVAKKYGNKKSSELSSDERREMIRDQREAESAVLEKNNVDGKELARYEAKMSLDDRAATRAERDRLDKKEQNEKKAAEQKQQQAQQPQEVQVQRGFSDDHPVTLEEKPAAAGQPTVERGLPPEAVDDQNAASGSSAPAAPPEVAPPPAKKSHGKK
ncbi:MAG: hypothetical protein IPJ65_13160 [Archangiaceae bacterium]|nr:hypothetical protein [Archangiaceae bacterium]